MLASTWTGICLAGFHTTAHLLNAQTVEVGLGQPAEDTSGDVFKAADLSITLSDSLQHKPTLEVIAPKA